MASGRTTSLAGRKYGNSLQGEVSDMHLEHLAYSDSMDVIS